MPEIPTTSHYIITYFAVDAIYKWKCENNDSLNPIGTILNVEPNDLSIDES